MANVFYLDVDDEITSAAARIRSSRGPAGGPGGSAGLADRHVPDQLPAACPRGARAQSRRSRSSPRTRRRGPWRRPPGCLCSRRSPSSRRTRGPSARRRTRRRTRPRPRAGQGQRPRTAPGRQGQQGRWQHECRPDGSPSATPRRRLHRRRVARAPRPTPESAPGPAARRAPRRARGGGPDRRSPRPRPRVAAGIVPVPDHGPRRSACSPSPPAAQRDDHGKPETRRRRPDAASPFAPTRTRRVDPAAGVVPAVVLTIDFTARAVQRHGQAGRTDRGDGRRTLHELDTDVGVHHPVRAPSSGRPSGIAFATDEQVFLPGAILSGGGTSPNLSARRRGGVTAVVAGSERQCRRGRRSGSSRPATTATSCG